MAANNAFACLKTIAFIQTHRGILKIIIGYLCIIARDQPHVWWITRAKLDKAVFIITIVADLGLLAEY